MIAHVDEHMGDEDDFHHHNHHNDGQDDEISTTILFHTTVSNPRVASTTVKASAWTSSASGANVSSFALISMLTLAFVKLLF